MGLQRNVCVALGNIGDPVAIPALKKVLNSLEPLVREHAAWALGRIGGDEALAALRDTSASDPDPEVRKEAAKSLLN